MGVMAAAIGWRTFNVRTVLLEVCVRLIERLRLASVCILGPAPTEKAMPTEHAEPQPQSAHEHSAAQEVHTKRIERKWAKRKARQSAREREKRVDDDVNTGAYVASSGATPLSGTVTEESIPPVTSACGRAKVFGAPLKGDDKYTGAVVGDDEFIYAVPGSAKRVLKVCVHTH